MQPSNCQIVKWETFRDGSRFGTWGGTSSSSSEAIDRRRRLFSKTLGAKKFYISASNFHLVYSTGWSKVQPPLQDWKFLWKTDQCIFKYNLLKVIGDYCIILTSLSPLSADYLKIFILPIFGAENPLRSTNGRYVIKYELSHKCVKPCNMWLKNRNGRPTICDFPI